MSRRGEGGRYVQGRDREAEKKGRKGLGNLWGWET